MSSPSNYDTPSPRTHQSDASQTERSEVPDSQRDSPVRRPSFEKLDANEVAKALQIADLLKTAKSGRPAPPPPIKTQPAKPKGPQKPTPPQAEFILRPPPIPFSGNTNPDAVALRATADILQVQKARATENIQRLEQLKLLNRKDPKAFLMQLVAGNLKGSETDKDGILGPTVGPEVEKLLAALEMGSKKENAEDDPKAGADDKEKTAERKDSAKAEDKPLGEKKEYPRFPTPQNIVRTPAINWSKYGILGETIDNMHEEQRTNPTLGEPDQLANRRSQPATPVVETDQVIEKILPPKAPRFVMAAPYDPIKEQMKKAARKGQS